MPAAAIVGIIGSVLFIAGFAALNFGFVTSESYFYQFANLFGAACFTYTAISPFNTGLFITEFVWALIGAYGLFKIIAIKKKRAAGAQPPVS